jgi:hypothetical protein
LRLLLLKAAALTFSQIGRKGQWKVVRFKKLLRFKLLSVPLFSHRITHINVVFYLIQGTAEPVA